jgi:hypothetical protein
MMPHTSTVPADRETDLAGRQTAEMLIDEIGAQSFPASDPPAWGVVAARLEQAGQDTQTSEPSLIHQQAE